MNTITPIPETYLVTRDPYQPPLLLYLSPEPDMWFTYDLTDAKTFETLEQARTVARALNIMGDFQHRVVVGRVQTLPNGAPALDIIRVLGPEPF